MASGVAEEQAQDDAEEVEEERHIANANLKQEQGNASCCSASLQNLIGNSCLVLPYHERPEQQIETSNVPHSMVQDHSCPHLVSQSGH